MENSQHTTERPTNIVASKMITEAKNLEEDVLYSEKGHFSIATVWKRVHLALGIPSSILAAAAGVSALKQYPNVAAGLAITVAVLTALITFLNPEKAAAAHHKAGVQYNILRGKLRRLHSIDLADQVPNTELRARLEALAEEKARIMEKAPHIGRFAYWLGKRSIGRKEHEYETDEAD